MNSMFFFIYFLLNILQSFYSVIILIRSMHHMNQQTSYQQSATKKLASNSTNKTLRFLLNKLAFLWKINVRRSLSATTTKERQLSYDLEILCFYVLIKHRKKYQNTSINENSVDKIYKKWQHHPLFELISGKGDESIPIADLNLVYFEFVNLMMR